MRLDVGAGRAVDSRGVWLDEHDLWLYLDDGTLLRLTLVQDFAAYGVSGGGTCTGRVFPRAREVRRGGMLNSASLLGEIGMPV